MEDQMFCNLTDENLEVNFIKTYFLKLFQLMQSFAIALILSGLLITILGYNPLKVTQLIYEGVFSSKFLFSEMLLVAIPISIIAVGYSISFRVSWYIGSEGAYVLGATIAVAVALHSPLHEQNIVIPFIFICSIIIGGLYAYLIALIKLKRKVSEVFLSIMFNSIAISIATYLYSDPWRAAKGRFASTARIPKEFWLANIWKGTRVHSGIYIALAIVVLAQIFISRTTFGFRIKATGANPRASLINGININRSTYLAYALSGGLAGLAGSINLLGFDHTMGEGISKNYGITAILVAFLAGFEPLLVIPSAILFCSLTKGSERLLTTLGLSPYVGYAISGVFLLGIILSKAINKEKNNGNN
jgi:ABC-type uncharacterized transport system permease subunit